MIIGISTITPSYLSANVIPKFIGLAFCEIVGIITMDHLIGVQPYTPIPELK
jgi:hypothetical protein